jgi:hypothetical protein
MGRNRIKEKGEREGESKREAESGDIGSHEELRHVPLLLM